MTVFASIKIWAKRIKRDAIILWFARRHSDTPLIAKGLCILAVAYALSPIDLIPDFIPIIGYVDDALLLPALIWLAVWLLPANVIHDCQAQAEKWMATEKTRPKSYVGAMVIVVIWLIVLYLCGRWYGLL